MRRVRVGKFVMRRVGDDGRRIGYGGCRRSKGRLH